MPELSVYKLTKAIGLSSRGGLYLVVAIKELFIARIRHAIEPAGKIVEALQRSSSHEVTDSEHSSGLDLTRLAWALGAAAARVPWRSDCLIQVMAAERWLRRHQIPSSFFLGVAMDTNGALRAHAWLRHDATVVAGSSGEGFSILIGPDAHPRMH